MFYSSILLSSLVVSIVAQDTKPFAFPSTGNGSVPAPPGNVESPFRPEVVRPEAPRPLTTAQNHFLPGPRRTFIHHRSDTVPYVYEHPYFGYPVAHSVDQSLGPPSKQLLVISFLGLLILFAIIQNTLANVKRSDATDVLSARDKRDLYAAYDFDSVTAEQEEVLNDDARVRCIQRTVCLENRKLLKAFGAAGKILAKYLTRGVGKSLKSSSGWASLVEDAGEAGIRGEDCDVLYRDCEEPVSPRRRRKSGTRSDRH